MKKRYYHKLTMLFFTLTVLLLTIVGFLMCYSDGVFTLGAFQIVLREQKQTPLPHPPASQLTIPDIPLENSFQNPNGVSNRIKHWDTSTHIYTSDNTSQYIYNVVSQTPPSSPLSNSDANVYLIPMGHQEQMLFVREVYSNTIQKIEQAIYQHVQTYDTIVTYSITYEYQNKEDVRPVYLRLEVYTPQDKGNTINWNILIHNNTF